MDPDVPQPSDSAPDEDAPPVMSPSESTQPSTPTSVSQSSQSSAPQVPPPAEPADEDETFLPCSVPTQPVVPAGALSPSDDSLQLSQPPILDAATPPTVATEPDEDVSNTSTGSEPTPTQPPSFGGIAPTTTPPTGGETLDEDAPAHAESTEPAPVVLPVSIQDTPSTVPVSSTVFPVHPEPNILHEAAAPKPRADMAVLSRLGLAKRQEEKAADKARLIILAQKKGHITATDVELLLRVSKSTAGLYLGELVAEGRLERRGQSTDTEYWWVE